MIFDGGRWDRIRSWGYWWKWERRGWSLRLDVALYSVVLPTLKIRTRAPLDDGGNRDGYSLVVSAWAGTRGLADPPVALELGIPVPYRPWLWLDWLLPDAMDGKRACRGWQGERWPWQVR